MPSPRALRVDPYQRGVVVLALVTLLLRAWTLSRWSWDNDDWIYMHNAETMGFWAYLVQDYNGHLMPGGFLLTWVIAKVAPLNFWFPVVIVSAACAGVVLVWGVALRRLAGPRPLTLAALALVALSPIYLRPTLWWAAATQALPMLLFMGLTVICAERWARTRTRGDLVRLLVTYAGGLLFWEKAVLLVLPVTAVLVVLGSGTLRARVWSARAPLASLAALTLVYLPVFFVVTSGTSANSIEFDAAATRDGGVEFLARGFAEMIAPALLGGPWGTLPVNGDVFGHPPLLQSVVLGSLLVVAALVAVRRVPGAWVAVAMAALYACVAWGMILFSNRFLLTGQHAVTDERFSADVLAAAVVALALVLGARGRSVAEEPARLAGRRRVGTAVLVAVGASLVVGNVLAIGRIGVHPGRAWVENLRADLGERSTPVVVWDANTPDSVIQPVFFPVEARLSYILRPYGERVRFAEPDRRISMVDPGGDLRGVEVADQSHAEPGPVDGCGYALGAGDRAVVPMSNELYLWDWGMQVNTFAAEGGELTVEVDGSVSRLRVGPGLEQHQVQLTTAVPDRITLSMSDDSDTVCVTDVVLGGVAPTAG